MFYTGVVENRDDPLKLGRCQVRVVGLHTHDKAILPTKDLPWATPMQPVTSAAMNGIGWTPVGPVEGTCVIIVFADEYQQQPIMIGTVGGIPRSKAQEIGIEDSVLVVTDGVLQSSSGPVTSSDGTVVTTGSSTTPKQENLTEQKNPLVVDDAVLKSGIITTPPPKSTSDPKAAEQNIKNLIEACAKVGITHKYAVCAILGICGGETGWIVKAEDTYYSSADYLASVFKLTFNKGTKKKPIPDPEAAKPYVRWQGSREDFFRKIYGPDGNGALVGHKDPNDGALYYGRGLNQITGKGLYTAIQNWLKTKGVVVDFVNNPGSLLSDPKIAALATVGFYVRNMTDVRQDDPAYFRIALTRTGADANGTGYVKKEKYYNYFLGGSTEVQPTNKPPADAQVTYTKEEVKDLPQEKQTALLEDRSEVAVVGFKDPSGKYPLRNLIDEPDTNRLARGIQKDTAVEFKDASRSKAIPAPNSEPAWEQPLAPFGGMYPYSKVMETESGHLLVYDDTPNNEYISFYHKTGSFIDIDANGSQVNKIVGDGYTIIDRNGSIYIGGRCNVTVGNSVNILVQGSANVQVDGTATINLNNNADIGVGGDLTLGVGGDIKVKGNGSLDIEIAESLNVAVGKGIGIVAGTNITSQAGEDIALKAGAAFSASSSKDMNLKAGGKSYLGGTGEVNIKSNGAVKLDGSSFLQQSGAAAMAAEAGSTEAITTGLDVPELAVGALDSYEYLSTPVRPSPPVTVKVSVMEENEERIAAVKADPTKYENAAATAAGVDGTVGARQPKDDGNGQSLISGQNPGDIVAFLTKQLDLNRTQKYWAEDASTKTGNQNIVRMWTDLGFSPKFAPNDGVAWCMCFVQWTLKQCGYRYYQTGWAYDIRDKSSKCGVTKVSFEEAQPGDIALWSYGHVNFVYKRLKNGGLTFVGGNQRPADKSNTGEVNENWISGYIGRGDGTLIGIFRPSKT